MLGWFTSSQWITLALIMVSITGFSMMHNVPPVIYPSIATSKGVSLTLLGVIFGCIQAACLVSAPFYGYILQTVNSKLLYIFGGLIFSIAFIGFGYVPELSSDELFLGLSIFLTIVQGIGLSAAYISLISILTREFPDKRSFVIALKQGIYGFGFMLGPLIAGILHGFFGPVVPYLAAGTFTILSLVFSLLFMPNYNKRSGATQNFPLTVFLKLPSSWLSIIGVVVAVSALMFINPSLEPRLHDLQLTSIKMGLVFSVPYMSFIIFNFVWSWTLEFVDPKYLMLVGTFQIFIAYSFIGPVPGVHIDSVILWTTVLGLAIAGMGASALFLACYVEIVRGAIISGFDDNDDLHAWASTAWQGSFSLGGCLGPLMAGVLYDAGGFRVSSLWMVILSFGYSILILCIVGMELEESPTSDIPLNEKTPSYGAVLIYNNASENQPPSPPQLPMIAESQAEVQTPNNENNQ